MPVFASDVTVFATLVAEGTNPWRPRRHSRLHDIRAIAKTPFCHVLLDPVNRMRQGSTQRTYVAPWLSAYSENIPMLVPRSSKMSPGFGSG